MTVRKRKRSRSTVKAKLGNVIKSLQSIQKHVDGESPKKRAAKKMKTIIFEEEPLTLDSPTLRRPPRSARETLPSARMSITPTVRYPTRY